MTDKIRVALVGVGVMGSKYADMIVSGGVKNMVIAGDLSILIAQGKR